MTRTDNKPLFRNRNVARVALLDEWARAMRASLTSSESLLWARIRGRRLGVQFRRQVPLLGRFIADFLAPTARLVLEAGHVCSSDGWCVPDADFPDRLCVAGSDAGAPCQAGSSDLIGNCKSGLSCFCQGTGCTPTCLYERREGETCGDALSFCIPGTTCQAGKCVGLELQGLAKAVCGQ